MLQVSIIIPAFNEERFLPTIFAAINKLSQPPGGSEVILVDNGSTDRTAEIARANGARVIDGLKLRVGGLRNLGACEARGKILAFLDADCLPNQDWLLQGLHSLELEPCVTGAEYLVPDDAGWTERLWFIQEEQGRLRINLINSGNLFVTRELFLELGGFDESLPSGEDAEFCLRALKKVPVIADSRIKVVHLGNPKTLGGFFRRELWHGAGALASLKRSIWDKPFWATVVFLFSCLGIIVSATFHLIIPLITSLAALSALMFLTLKIRGKKASNLKERLQVLVLYLTYYTARSIALIRLAFGMSYQRRAK